MNYTFELLDSKRTLLDRVTLEEYDAEKALACFEERGYRGNVILQRAGSRPEAATLIGVFDL